MIDSITDAPPFSIDFYRAFARNGYESPTNLSKLYRWTVAPSFYIKTTVAETGEEVSAVSVERLRRVFTNAVPELSGGRLSVAAIETGPEARPDRPGWVNVLFQFVLPASPTAAGQATVGGNQGTMWIKYTKDTAPTCSTAPGPPGVGNITTCIYPQPGCVAVHEIVHTMGFFHTDNFLDFLAPSAILHAGDIPECTGAGYPARTRYHVGIVYSRPPGNTDPDADPPTFVLGLGAAPPIPQVVVSCPLESISRPR